MNCVYLKDLKANSRSMARRMLSRGSAPFRTRLRSCRITLHSVQHFNSIAMDLGGPMDSQRGKWTKPALVVIVRGKPEESVMDSCKMLDSSIDPANQQAGCLLDCSGCVDLYSS